MSDATPIHVTSETFSSEVLESDTPVLLQFWSPTCVPCMIMKRLVGKAAESLGDEAQVALINVDQEPELTAKFGVQGTPTFAILSQGRVVDTFSGIMGGNRIVERVRRAALATG